MSGGVTEDVKPAVKAKNGANGNGELTGLQRAYVEEWFACRYNGTEAARRAGYQGDDNTLATQSWRLLRMAKIKDAIGQRFASGVTPQEVVNILTEQARGSLADFLDDHGKIDIEKVRSDKGRLVSEYTELDNGSVRLKLYSSQKAAELVGKALGVFEESVELKGVLNISLDR